MSSELHSCEELFGVQDPRYPKGVGNRLDFFLLRGDERHAARIEDAHLCFDEIAKVRVVQELKSV